MISDGFVSPDSTGESRMRCSWMRLGAEYRES